MLCDCAKYHLALLLQFLNFSIKTFISRKPIPWPTIHTHQLDFKINFI